MHSAQPCIHHPGKSRLTHTSWRVPSQVDLETRGWPDVITVFLCSLVQHWDGKLVAVIVSGLDGDGAAALSRIKQVGGITIAQSPETAVKPDMPESAIESGYIDCVLSPEGIAQELVRIAHAPPMKATGVAGSD